VLRLTYFAMVLGSGSGFARVGYPREK
jgi:hypothetical protein